MKLQPSWPRLPSWRGGAATTNRRVLARVGSAQVSHDALLTDRTLTAHGFGDRYTQHTLTHICSLHHVPSMRLALCWSSNRAGPLHLSPPPPTYPAPSPCRSLDSFSLAVVGDLHLAPEQMGLFNTAQAQLLKHISDARGRILPGRGGGASVTRCAGGV